MISTHDRDDYGELALASGARGFLSKLELSAQALEALGVALDWDVAAAWEPAPAAPEERLPRRAAAAAAGLHAAVGFPVRSERGVVGVIEGYAGQVQEPDLELLATLEVVGAQLGQLVERRRAERSGDAVERRHRATLQAASRSS